MSETDEVAQAETRSINLVCTIKGPDWSEDITASLPLDHQDIAETKFENFIGELARALGEYFEEPEQDKPNTIYPH